jgi:hypothetical protein
MATVSFVGVCRGRWGLLPLIRQDQENADGRVGIEIGLVLLKHIENEDFQFSISFLKPRPDW